MILTTTSGSIDALSSGQVLVSDGFAKDHGLGVGQTLNGAIGTLPRTELTIGGVFARSQVLNDPAIIVPDALRAGDAGRRSRATSSSTSRRSRGRTRRGSGARWSTP